MSTKPRKEDRARDEHLYGCTCDLAPDEEPDGCVIDYGALTDCIYAPGRRTKWTCPYWIKKSEWRAALTSSEDSPNA